MARSAEQIRIDVNRACKEYGGVRVVARAMKMGFGRVSEVKTGKSQPSANFETRFYAAITLPDVGEKEKPQGSEGSKQNPHAVWLNRQTGDSVDDTRAAENARDSVDEIDRLVLAECYQTMRRAVLAVAAGAIPELDGVLLAPPSEGPSVALGLARARLRERIEEARTRQAEINPDVSSELYRRYSQFREQLERKLARLAVDDRPEELIKLGAWRATVTTLSALFRPHTDLRVKVVEALRSGDLLSATMAGHLDRVRAITFPCLEYKYDPLGYVRTILGEDPWHVEGPIPCEGCKGAACETCHGNGEYTPDSQLTLLLSVRDNRITISPSGRGLGKTTGVAWLCNWWKDTRLHGRVFITNFTGNQLRAQDWAEIIRCAYRSGICWDCKQAGVTQRPCPHSQCIPTDEISEIPTKGIWSEDKERFILGVTAADAQATGGYHGEEILVICDEFSGTKQEMFEIWDRSIVGPDSRFLGPGNPLDGPGSPMHDMVTDERVKKLYNVNVVSLDGEVAALAGKSYLPTAEQNRILAEKDPRGREAPDYMISVRGRYPAFDEDVIYSPGEIIKASDPTLYADRKPEGPLVLGIDPTGESASVHDMGVVCVMRGLVVLEWRCSYNWTFDDYLREILDAWKAHRISPTEVPIVGVDADGVGARLIIRLQNYLDSLRVAAHLKCNFQLYPIYFGHQAINWREYEYTGDEGRELVSRWLHAGGVFPYNVRLIRAMQHARWHRVRKPRNGEMLTSLRSCTRKENTPDAFRKVLGYSPDELDALTIAQMAAEKAELGIIPDERSSLEVEDSESIPRAPVDDRNAMRNYIHRLRHDRTGTF